MTERRRFSRIPFGINAVLQGSDGAFDVRVLDLSLRGALLEADGSWPMAAGACAKLLILLAPGTEIRMEVRLVHLGADQAGFACERIDLSSLEHLRRLAELNLADAELLQRELSELSAG